MFTTTKGGTIIRTDNAGTPTSKDVLVVNSSDETPELVREPKKRCTLCLFSARHSIRLHNQRLKG